MVLMVSIMPILREDANAVKFDELTHGEVIQRGLKIMDATASTLSMDNDIDLVCV